jgi:hypothetical protein
MAGVQFVIEAGKGSLVCSHARLGFESYEHISDWHLVKNWQATEFPLLGSREVDTIVAAQIRKRPPLRTAARRQADHEVEIFLSVVLEIAHLVIDAEADPPIAYVLPEKRRRAQQIEHDTPTSHLGVMVTAAVVAPSVAVPVCHMR